MKCIYCGSNDLSRSDIIPDALTNGKIINPCVCRIKHNSKFSDLFEDDVIKAFAVFTNELDVKSSKGSKYAPYDATIGIAGDQYKAKVSSGTEVFSGNKVLKSADGKSLIGPLDEIKKIKVAKETDIKIVNVNEEIVEQRINLDLAIFFSESIYRLASKIAYEWFCLRNKIEDKYDQFEDIINFITEGQKKREIVDIVSNKELYEYLNNLAGFGSHVLLSYEGTDGYIHVIVSLFGIVMYDVSVCKNNELCKSIALFQMVTLDAKQKWFAYSDIKDLEEDFSNSFNEVKIGPVVCKVPKDPTDDILNEKLSYINMYDYLQQLSLTNDTQSLIPILLKGIKDVLQASALTMRGLRRFIKEHRDYIDSRKGLNPKATNKKSIFLFYLLYIVGRNDYINSLMDLNNYLRQNIGEGEIQVTEEVTNNYLQNMLKEKDYMEAIVVGANKIEAWSM